MKKIVSLVISSLFTLPLIATPMIGISTAGFENFVSGDTVVLTDYAYNLLTDEPQFAVEGSLMSDGGSVMVTITRSQGGIADEFCMSGTCRAGNEQEEETLIFNVQAGMSTWFIHYSPVSPGIYTASYSISDGTGESFVMTIVFDYQPTAIEQVQLESGVTKVIRNGMIEIHTNNTYYNILGL